MPELSLALDLSPLEAAALAWRGPDDPDALARTLLRDALAPLVAGYVAARAAGVLDAATLAARLALADAATRARVGGVLERASPRVVLLTGQSNMGGWDAIEVPAAPEDAGLVVAGGWWTPPVPGTAPGTIRVRNGPGLAFARALVRGGIARVGLVGAAAMSSAIRQWLPGQPIYEASVAAVRATGHAPSAVLFYQGEIDARSDITETDTGVPLEPLRWGELCAEVIAGWRTDFGDPDLPVLVVRLAHDGTGRRGHLDEIRAQQDALPARVPGVVLVDAEPAVLRDAAGVHLDDASMAALGERLGAAYLALVRVP